MRQRKVRANLPPHTGTRHKKPTCSSNRKSVSAAQRAKEFSGENITVSAGKLFCTASLKLSIIKNHTQSAKHTQRKKLLIDKQSRECDLARAFKSYEQEVHPAGETLSDDHKLWRVKVETTFMRAGVPLAKIERFKELLEENAYRLTDRHGMCDLIPFVQQEEQQRLS